MRLLLKKKEEETWLFRSIGEFQRAPCTGAYSDFETKTMEDSKYKAHYGKQQVIMDTTWLFQQLLEGSSWYFVQTYMNGKIFLRQKCIIQ